MVSALEPGKRVIEAMHAVADVPEAYLVVAGDGPLRAEIDRLAGEILPGRFMRRTFRHEQMPDLYRSADVFLHTKVRESFGNVYIEALSCGVPIVANDDEVTRWILGEHGVLVDAGSQRALVDGIGRALRERQARNEGAAWAQERYSWGVVARRYADFFMEVVDRSNSGRGTSRVAPRLAKP
jgi:glycosyltransferase involved in cell wall biosynthesis